MSDYARLLEPYRSRIIDERFGELALALLAWCAPRCTCLERVKPHVKQVFESAMFAYFSAPSDTTDDESLFLAKHALLFFQVDDGPATDLPELLSHLDGSCPAGVGEATTWYRAMVADMRAAGLRTREYAAAVLDMCAAIAREREINVHQVQAAQYWMIRRFTIAGPGYIACWIALRHRHLDAVTARAWSELGLFTLADQVVALINDLGSLESDLTPPAPGEHAELNFALIRHPGLTSLDARVEATIDLANRKTAQIQHRFALVDELAAALREPRLLEIVPFVVSYVNGNLDTTLHLTTRYERAIGRLLRLRRLEPEARAAGRPCQGA